MQNIRKCDKMESTGLNRVWHLLWCRLCGVLVLFAWYSVEEDTCFSFIPIADEIDFFLRSSVERLLLRRAMPFGGLWQLCAPALSVNLPMKRNERWRGWFTEKKHWVGEGLWGKEKRGKQRAKEHKDGGRAENGAIKRRRARCFAEAAFSNQFYNAVVDRWLCPGTRPIVCCLSLHQPIRLQDSQADFCHCCTSGMTQEINLSFHKGCFSSHTTLLNNSSKHTHAYFGSSSRTFNKISELSNWTH